MVTIVVRVSYVAQRNHNDVCRGAEPNVAAWGAQSAWDDDGDVLAVVA